MLASPTSARMRLGSALAARPVNPNQSGSRPNEWAMRLLVDLIQTRITRVTWLPHRKLRLSRTTLGNQAPLMNANPPPILPSVLFGWIPKAAQTSAFFWLNGGMGNRRVRSASAPTAHVETRLVSLPVTPGCLCLAQLDRHDWIARVALEGAWILASARNLYERLASFHVYIQGIVRLSVNSSLGSTVGHSCCKLPGSSLGHSSGRQPARPLSTWLSDEGWSGANVAPNFERIQVAVRYLRMLLGVAERPESLSERPSPPSSKLIYKRSVALVRKSYADDLPLFEDRPEPTSGLEVES